LSPGADFVETVQLGFIKPRQSYLAMMATEEGHIGTQHVITSGWDNYSGAFLLQLF
jgi:hypothetical protein